MEEHREVSEDEFKNIVDSCEKLILEDPKNPEVWTRKGMALMGLGRAEEAVKSFDEALKLKPDMIWALDNMCMALLLSERYEESLDCFNKAIGNQSRR